MRNVSCCWVKKNEVWSRCRLGILEEVPKKTIFAIDPRIIQNMNSVK